MKHPVQAFAPNLEGRDFVIGDLHGCYALFDVLLEAINFDPLKDRVFSVGDLVDRGPESLRCLELLYEPWFHSVLANHEQMMLEAFHGHYMGQFWVPNGGEWGMEALNDWRMLESPTAAKRVPGDDSVRLFDLLDKVAELPFIITVGLKSGKKVHIIHAELPVGRLYSDRLNDEVLADPAKVTELASVQSDEGEFFTWGRYLYGSFYRADLSNLNKVKRTVAYHLGSGCPFKPELSHIISGHTIVQRPLTILGQTNIDTGAYGAMSRDASGWEALTCIELDTWTFYQVRPSGVTKVEPVVVTHEDVERLKGSQSPDP
jgi:hypothetical protein